MVEILQALYQPVYFRPDGTPVWLAMGAAVDIQVGDDDDVEEPDDADDDEDERPARRGRETARDGDEDDDLGDESDDDELEQDSQESERVEALKRRQEATRRGHLKNKRLQAILREHGIDPTTGQKIDADDESVEDESAGGEPADVPRAPAKDAAALKRQLTRAERRGEAKAEATYKPMVFRLAAQAALREAGCTKDFGRVARVLDLEDLEIEDGQVVGIKEQVDDIKAEFPEWFNIAPPRRQPRSRREARESGARGASDVDGVERRRPYSTAPRSWVERASSQIDGSRR
jgi:hypothetical protein